jgi:hypothetical protein
MVNLELVHPVIDGRWHRVRLHKLPNPGELITTLCGQVEEVEYGTGDRVVTLVPCWHCDLAYRRQEGIAVRLDHPGLAAPPAPPPRTK